VGAWLNLNLLHPLSNCPQFREFPNATGIPASTTGWGGSSDEIRQQFSVIEEDHATAGFSLVQARAAPIMPGPAPSFRPSPRPPAPPQGDGLASHNPSLRRKSSDGPLKPLCCRAALPGTSRPCFSECHFGAGRFSEMIPNSTGGIPRSTRRRLRRQSGNDMARPMAPHGSSSSSDRSKTRGARQ